MAWTGRSPLVVVGVSLILCRAGPALAACAPDYADLVPWDGSTGVGTDVRPIWVGDELYGEPALTLTEADSGAAVAVDVLWQPTSGSVGYSWITPRVPLDPFTGYAVSDGEHTLGFETGAGTTTSAPLVPTVTDTRAWACLDLVESDSCDGTSAWIEGVTPSAGVAVSVQEIGPDEGILQARVDLDTGLQALVLGTRDRVIANAFGCSWNMEELYDAQSATVSVRTVDFAGNASDWSEPITIALPWPEGCPDDAAKVGCSTGSSPGVGLAALCLALAAAWSRRWGRA